MRIGSRICRVMLLVLIVVFPDALFAAESFEKEPAETNHKLVPHTDMTAGLFAGYNPLLALIFLETVHLVPYKYSKVFGDVWSHVGLGVQTIACPGYLQQGALFEWMPALFLVFRLRYDIYGYLGAFGEVLSYDSPPDHFMESDLNDRKGDEESAFGQRVFFQPTLRGKVGRVSFQSQTDIAWYDTAARGPYVFNWDYETFTALRDIIIENRTDVLLALQEGEGESGFMFGPQYTFTWTPTTALKRHRVGVSVYWVPRDRKYKNGYFWAYLASGVNIRAALEQGSPYLLLVLGGSWRLSNRRHSK